jgi:LysR family transcriptional regulator, glycine cleavage system transcriptional activator
MQTPSLKFLRTFHIAARKASFKLAADELFITASAVSHQIKTLEDQLGLVLFERNAHSLTLTEAGSYYLQGIDGVFARLDSVTDQLRNRYRKQLVRLQVPPFFGSELLLPRLSKFSATYSEVDIHVGSLLLPHTEHSAEADVSVLVGMDNWSDLTTRRLFSQRFVAACAPHLMQGKNNFAVSDLNDEALIVHTRRLDLWDQWTSMQGLESLRPRQVIRLDSMRATVQAAEQGLGFALASAQLAETRFAAGTLVQPFRAELVTGESYYLVARPEAAQRPAVAALMDWMASEFGDVEPGKPPQAYALRFNQ